MKRDITLGWKHASPNHDSHCECRVPEPRDEYDPQYGRGEDWVEEIANDEDAIAAG